VLRSENGAAFTQIAKLTSGTRRTFTDSGLSTNATYRYEVEAVSGLRTSSPSNTATATTTTTTTKAAPPPSSPPGSVTITTRYSNELVITSGAGSDTISVSEKGTILTILADGLTYTLSALAGGLFIYNRGGADSITIDPSVTARTTITSIGAGTTSLSSGDANLSAWLDATDKFSGKGIVHLVGSFAGGVSKAQGAALANPKDAGQTTKLNESLWGTGPAASDVNQGGVGDCFFLSSLAAFAGTKPGALQESAVDMGTAPTSCSS